MNSGLTRYPAAGESVPADLLAHLEPRMRMVRIRRSQLVLTAGAVSTEVYLLLEGRLQVTLFSPGGREIIIRDLAPGTFVGELAALDGGPRAATVVALDDGVMGGLPASVFADALATVPGAGLWLARKFAAQVRVLTDRLFELSALAVRERLHCELLRLCVEAGVTSNQALIAPAPTHAALAARIGTHREAVTRELGDLALRGLLSQDRRQLAVRDVAALAQAVRSAAGDLAPMPLAAAAL